MIIHRADNHGILGTSESLVGNIPFKLHQVAKCFKLAIAKLRVFILVTPSTLVLLVLLLNSLKRLGKCLSVWRRALILHAMHCDSHHLFCEGCTRSRKIEQQDQGLTSRRAEQKTDANNLGPAESSKMFHKT